MAGAHPAFHAVGLQLGASMKEGGSDDLKCHPRPGRAGRRRGPRTSPVVGSETCKSRAVLTVRKDAPRPRRATVDAMVKPSGWIPRYMKTVLEASVWKSAPTFGLGMLREPGCLQLTTGCARHGYASPVTRFWGKPVQSGVEPSTYSIVGSFFEHMNLNPSAGNREARQTAKSGHVLDEGRSLRCSPSTGEPCTWR